MSNNYQKDHYYTYGEMYDLLTFWANAYPNLFSFASIGKSYEGRDIWAVTLTDTSLKPAPEKPAYYIDANHHAGEVTGSAVALYTINYLLQNFGSEPRATRLLQSFTFYIIPRIAVDGSELYLTTPYMLRSSVRPYSPTRKHGTVIKDIDQDGRILQMRIKNPNGKFKISEKDARLMIPRQPDDWHGTFYDLYPEGEVEKYDNFEIKPTRSKWGLDFNRNYPMSWQPEAKQKGAGPFSFSEPETRAVGTFILNHDNIAGVMSYHTSGGVILRPYCIHADEKMPKQDFSIYQALGEIGQSLTGYPCWSIFENFTVDKERPSVGSFMDYIYDYLGIISFATELWDMRGQAGLPKLNLPQRIKQNAKEKEEDGLKLLAWNDEKFNGALFVNWYPFEHPQLGSVELGGWLPKFGRQNPPAELLAQECHKNMLFTLSHAESLPRLVLSDCQVQTLEEGHYHLTVSLTNAGYLPTTGSKTAEINKVVKPITVKLEGNVTVTYGPEELEIASIPGYGKHKLEWFINATPNSVVNLSVTGHRAGTIRQAIVLN